MRTTSTTDDTQYIDDIDDEMMDDIDGEIEKRLESKRKRSGDYLRKIEELMEARRLKSDLDDYDDWEYGTEPLPHENWKRSTGSGDAASAATPTD